MNDWYVLNTARNWVAAVAHQGERVLSLQEGEIRNGRQCTPDFTYIEDHLFVTTVHKSVEWLVEAHKRNLTDPDTTSSFITAADHARVVRNIREHHIQYLNGGGKQRPQDLFILEFNDGEMTAAVDASSVIVTDEGRLIGGRLNVQLLMREASALDPALLEDLNAIMQRESQY